MELLWFLVIAVIVIVVIGLIWQAFGVGNLLANASPMQRTLIALVGLLIIIVILFYFFSGYLPLPR